MSEPPIFATPISANAVSGEEAVSPPPGLHAVRELHLAEHSPDVLVLGGGIIGLACARALARRGARVEVVEHLEHGAEASLAAAGMLSPLAEPQPGPLFEACRASRDLWPALVAELEEETGTEVDYDASGAYEVALTASEAGRLAELARTAGELGEKALELPVAEARERVADLAAETLAVLHLPGEHRVDNVKACLALAQSASEEGARISYGFRVDRVEISESEVRVSGPAGARSAELLVVAAGAWSGRVGGLPPLPVKPIRGQMVLLGGIDWGFGGIVRGPEVYAVRRGAQGLLVGSTSEDAGFDCHTTVGGIGSLLSRVARLLPGLAERRIETSWAGLRPATMDGLPILGRLGTMPLVFATGHYRNGILLAPWTAKQITNLIFDGMPAPALAPFSPGRFF